MMCLIKLLSLNLRFIIDDFKSHITFKVIKGE
jgi:hypothetical protein